MRQQNRTMNVKQSNTLLICLGVILPLFSIILVYAIAFLTMIFDFDFPWPK